MKKYKPVSLKKITTYPLGKRKSKVNKRELAKVHEPGVSLSGFLGGLPDILAARDLTASVDAIVRAREAGRPVILSMGAHPIKCGLSPIIIDLMDRGIITALATNGAAIVHDFEMAYTGKTSEDVAAALKDGSFGMAKETGAMLNKAITKGAKAKQGIGKSVGAMINSGKFENSGMSIFAAADWQDIPATVHVAVGTDIIHMHPDADGAAIGQGSLHDFKLLADVVSDLEGGVFLNLGSAVIMPEVFLKALSVARNLGNTVDNITTINMDFIQQYRARVNVCHRPTMSGGASYALTGHHEIMFPLLAAAVIEKYGR